MSHEKVFLDLAGFQVTSDLKLFFIVFIFNFFSLIIMIIVKEQRRTKKHWLEKIKARDKFKQQHEQKSSQLHLVDYSLKTQACSLIVKYTYNK